MRESTSTQTFDALADRYDRLIEWPKRLAREGAFFRGLFDEYRVRRVADVACGTGHHAALFHSWGLTVEGSDISAAMLERCLALHGTDERLTWSRRSFVESPATGARFDAVTCLGNSLALSPDAAAAGRAVAAMVEGVRPGGIGVLQLLNLAAIEEGPIRWQTVRAARRDDRTVILVKGVHRAGRRGYVDLLEIDPSRDPVEWRCDTATMIQLGVDDLRAMLHAARATALHVFGSYERAAYDEATSGDLIIVWWRPLCG